jgi:hypothetical protein
MQSSATNEVGDGATGTTKRTQRKAAAALQALDAASVVLRLGKRTRQGLYGFYRAPLRQLAQTASNHGRIRAGGEISISRQSDSSIVWGRRRRRWHVGPARQGNRGEGRGVRCTQAWDTTATGPREPKLQASRPTEREKAHSFFLDYF